MCQVGLFEAGDLVAGQPERLGCQGVLDMSNLGRADDRRGHPWPAKQPRQCDLRAGEVPLGRDFGESVDYVEVNVGDVE